MYTICNMGAWSVRGKNSKRLRMRSSRLLAVHGRVHHPHLQIRLLKPPSQGPVLGGRVHGLGA